LRLELVLGDKGDEIIAKRGEYKWLDVTHAVHVVLSLLLSQLDGPLSMFLLELGNQL